MNRAFEIVLSYVFFREGRLGEAAVLHGMKYLGFAKSGELCNVIKDNIGIVWEQQRVAGFSICFHLLFVLLQKHTKMLKLVVRIFFK